MKKSTLLCLVTAAAALPFLAVPTPAPAALDDLKPRRAANTPDVSADRAALLEGVVTIGAPGSPGGVTAFGPGAFAVVGGEDGKTALAPVVAAARFEKGRIVAFGHGGYFESFADKDTGKLLLNAVRWTAGDAKPGKRPRVAVVGRADVRMGEVGHAVVVPVAGAARDTAALLAWCRENMANYKVPRSIDWVDELPVNAAGKVQRFLLKPAA